MSRNSRSIELTENDPFDYFPLKDGLKPSSVGLKRLPAYGDPQKDCRFQFDSLFHRYRASKIRARNERLSKYYQNSGAVDPQPVLASLVDELTTVYPNYFSFDGSLLKCYLTGNELRLDDRYRLVDQKTDLEIPYVDAFDAIAMQVSEDLILHSVDGTRDFSSIVHLFHPNGWSAESSVGQSFASLHQGVPKINRVIPNPTQMVLSLIRAPHVLERIAAISFRTDTILNRHPEQPDSQRHRPFDLVDNPCLFMRLERQTVTGFPQISSFLFTIKTYFVDCDQAGRDDLKHECIRAVFEQNDPNAFSHKFINENRAQVLAWLDERSLAQSKKSLTALCLPIAEISPRSSTPVAL